MDKMKQGAFGVIVGNRGFFPDVLAQQGRKSALAVLEQNGYKAVVLSEKDTKYGAVETFEDAKKCAALFASRADEIEGIIVTLPNFGDEKGVAETIRRSGLDVPILIHAEPDDLNKMALSGRRDSFCGKISVCNNLRQMQVPFTLTDLHTVKVDSPAFARDLDDFAAVCRIVKGLRNVRFGAIGTRPGAFNTVRYSEKLLEQAGITVETIDLSEILFQAKKLGDADPGMKDKLSRIKEYTNTEAVPEEILIRIAKFGLVVDNWVEQMELSGTAIQCW